MADNKVEIGFDLNDGDMMVSPETLRRLADELEAKGKTTVRMIEFASDTFICNITLPPTEGIVTEDDEDDEDDDEDGVE